MSNGNYPLQAIFSIEREDWGSIILSDGSHLDVRFVLADLTITAEDLLGAQAIMNHTVVLRSRASPELIKKLADKPLPPETTIPMTKEEGFENIEIQSVEKPIQSVYSFAGKLGKYSLTVEVYVQNVVRNMRFKTPNGAPIYNIRWTLSYRITKV